MTRFHDHRFPGESVAYRNARDKLLAAEVDLRREVERVAAMRRALPQGGTVPEDYEFDSADGSVTMSSLFASGHDTLALYSLMFRPGEKPCPMCSSMLDGLDGNARQAGQRLSLAVVAKAPVNEIREFAEKRGWRHLRLLSAAGNGYSQAYFGENAEGNQLPMLNVFTRDGQTIHHRYATELMFALAEAGQDPRHVDMLWPLWNLLDLTPGGRGDWYPDNHTT